MKMKLEHYEYLKNGCAGVYVDAKYITEHRAWLASKENPRPPKDLEKRLRHDILRRSVTSHWICTELYPYLDDNHIDTAMRRIVAELEAA